MIRAEAQLCPFLFYTRKGIKLKIRRILITLFGAVLILTGILIFAYPVISNHEAVKNQAHVIEVYEQKVENSDIEAMEQARKEAQEYNDSLVGNPVHDPFVPGSGYALPENYNSVLNLNGDGIMGYLEIPKINVRLPIAHGTSDEAMLSNVGHIESTALPIGGIGTHTVLTGHRGLPSAELLTRLDEMKKGDLFFISVLSETLAYEVDKITVVEPYELQELRTETDKDLATVLTCTPYGVNTQRLLVRGKRVEYVPEMKEVNHTQVIFEGLNNKRLLQGMLLGFSLVIIILIIPAVIARRRKSK